MHMYYKTNNNGSNNKENKNQITAFSWLSSIFPFGVVMTRAGRSTVGSQPGRTSAIIPLRMQGAL